MRRIIFLFMLGFAMTFYGQSKLTYGYDAAGNRIKREIVLTRAQDLGEDTEPQVYSEMLQKYSISISPNPIKELVTITISGLDKNSKGQIAMYNIGGQLIEKRDIVTTENTFDLSSQPNGIFLIQIRIDEQVTSWKIVKQ